MQNKIAEKIKELRAEAGLTPSQLAERSGLSLGYISKLEDGNYTSLKLSTCKSLADGFGLTLKDFIDKIEILDEKQQRPSADIIKNALRNNGYSDNQVNEIIRYAQYLRKTT
ncbi:MAG TPA: XRE family transcriptional regulator [Candidatus Uhrbacteria bacterium]|nr:XRE family transcriptional regulator [Candidatus Uhrbacteria bacterium]